MLVSAESSRGGIRHREIVIVNWSVGHLGGLNRPLVFKAQKRCPKVVRSPG